MTVDKKSRCRNPGDAEASAPSDFLHLAAAAARISGRDENCRAQTYPRVRCA